MSDVPTVEVEIEIPRWSYLKRGSTGHVDFVSPLPCPFNYGAVPTMVGLEGDLLDAVVLGPTLPLGARVNLPAWGANRCEGWIDAREAIACARPRPASWRGSSVGF